MFNDIMRVMFNKNNFKKKPTQEKLKFRDRSVCGLCSYVQVDNSELRCNQGTAILSCSSKNPHGRCEDFKEINNA